jgi:hypothetical protein
MTWATKKAKNFRHVDTVNYAVYGKKCYALFQILDSEIESHEING